MAVKWTENLVLSVISEARKAGFIAAEKKLVELINYGAQFTVIDGGKVTGKMLDVCGFANLKILARGKFYLLAKKLADDPQRRFHCCRAYYGGGSLSIFDSTHRQEMSINIAACKGQAVVLRGYGIEASVTSRID